MKYALLMVLVFLLAACAPTAVVPAISDTQAYQQQLAALKTWQLDGKIAIRHANKSDSAAVHWEQDDGVFDIYLSGPLGAHASQITGTPDLLTLSDSGGEHTATDKPEDMIERRLGWTFPIENLPLWILGATRNPQATFNADHTLASFEQDGWQVRYLSYQGVDRWLLPSRIELRHEDLTVTIVIKDWSL